MKICYTKLTKQIVSRVNEAVNVTACNVTSYVIYLICFRGIIYRKSHDFCGTRSKSWLNISLALCTVILQNIVEMLDNIIAQI